MQPQHPLAKCEYLERHTTLNHFYTIALHNQFTKFAFNYTVSWTPGLNGTSQTCSYLIEVSLHLDSATLSPFGKEVTHWIIDDLAGKMKPDHFWWKWDNGRRRVSLDSNPASTSRVTGHWASQAPCLHFTSVPWCLQVVSWNILPQGQIMKQELQEVTFQKPFMSKRVCDPVLSSYPIMYPEQTTPIVLVTPIPLLKWTEFPPQARVGSKFG